MYIIHECMYASNEYVSVNLYTYSYTCIGGGLYDIWVI